MREILFRGKRIDNGEWVEGFYGHSGDKVYIIIDNDIAVGYFQMREVIPETIGQYTGLTDNNGKKIFEGDIVDRFVYTSNDVVCFGKHDIFCCGCCYSSHQTVGFYLGQDDSSVFADEDAWDVLTIVGNIHDNPELLKGGE